jgi:hypothetical protein
MINQDVDFDNQADPMMGVLLNGAETVSLELGIQGAASQSVQLWSQGAMSNADTGNSALSAIANNMAGDVATMTGSDNASKLANALAVLNAQYNTEQTRISNSNSNYSNIVQGGGAILTNLTQVQAQSLQSCQVAVDFNNALNQLIMNWSS